MDKNIEWFYSRKLELLKPVLEKKGYNLIEVSSIDDLKNEIKKLINLNETVGISESSFFEKIGLIKFLERYNFNLLNHFKETDLSKKEELKRKSLLADKFIAEIDFITEKGELIFVGDFNATAPIFGIDNLLCITTKDKIIKDLDTFEKILNEYVEIKNDVFFTPKNYSIIDNGRKFENKYTLFILN